MSNVQFPTGISAFKPNDKAPSFIKANISIKKAELIEWLKSQGDTIKLDLKESKDSGKYYLSVNDFAPAQKDVTKAGSYTEQVKKQVMNDTHSEFRIDSHDDLPF